MSALLKSAKPVGAQIVWRYTPGLLPDEGLTVLGALDSNDCGAWPVYLEDGLWHDAATGTRLMDDVYAWTELELPEKAERT